MSRIYLEKADCLNSQESKKHPAKIILSVAILFLFVGLLSFDQDLDPEISSWTKLAPVPDGDNGFVYLMGLDSGSGESPLDRGFAKIQAYNRGRESQADPFATVDIDSSRLEQSGRLELPAVKWLCKHHEKGCFDALVLDPVALVSIVDLYADLIDRYQLFIGGPNYQTTTALYADAPIPPIRYLNAGHQLLRAGAVWGFKQGNTEQALALIALELRGLRKHLASVDTLLMKLTIIELIEDNLAFLEFLYGKRAFQADASLVLSLSPVTHAERSLDLVAKREFLMAQKGVRYWAKHPWSGTALKWIPGWLIRPFYKPNMTQNQLYRVYSDLGHWSELSAVERPEFESDQELSLLNIAGSAKVSKIHALYQPNVTRLDQLSRRIEEVAQLLTEKQQ